MIDRNGKVRETTFGQTGDLAPKIQILLDE